ncbi:hypothetical protein GCM10007359_01280 [Rothia aerolata]|uniref:APC family permease n=1 Tax=Rothia aerolata TaxID=1812262 RepID=A0A917IJZ6_9MICC|nr:hypothetical protein GCM10007359_01280 [Rothia aerolata]
MGRLERTVLGQPAHRTKLATLVLPKRRALPLLGADSISSVAYAPDEIILMLAFAGGAGLIYSPWVGFGVGAILLAVVGTYRYNISQIAEQGDYQLVHRRLGAVPAMVLGASSMVDFLLTVAVSAASGSAFLQAIWPGLIPYDRWVAISLVLLTTLLCVRGMRFMGKISAIPTYAFLLLLSIVLVVGLVEAQFGWLSRAESADYYIIPRTNLDQALTGLGLAVLLARAFSSGAVALSGVSAVNNSVKFFARPKKTNAASTLMLMGAISSVLLVSILYLVEKTGAKVVADPQRYLMVDGALVGENFYQKPVLFQVTDAVFAGQAMPVLLSLATVGILMMATATAFMGFPLLTSKIAEHRYLPIQLSARTSQNLYGNSVLVLSATAVFLVAIFGSDVNSLIQLYIVGVFTSMTLTQTAIVRHKIQQLRVTLDRFKRRRVIRDLIVTALGLLATALSLLVVLLTKLAQGAWITVLLITATVGIMLMVRKHYSRIDNDLELDLETGAEEARRLPSRVRAVIYVPRVRKPVARAVAYARASRPSSIEAVAINMHEDSTKEIIKRWEQLGVPVPLTVLDSPYRDPVTPVMQHIRELKQRSPRDVLVVYLPEYIVRHWWENLIHRRTVHKLAAQLRRENRIVIAQVPWNIGKETEIITPSPLAAQGDSRG